MYKEGEIIVYGNTGVCRVAGYTTPDIPGADGKLYYQLEPLYLQGVIYAPVEGGKVFMRPVISRDEAESIIARIPEINAREFDGHSEQELAEHYRASLNAHDCADLVELLKSIYAKRQRRLRLNRRVGRVDERFRKQGEELLFGELATALDIPRDKIEKYIDDKVKALEKQRKAEEPQS